MGMGIVSDDAFDSELSKIGPTPIKDVESHEIAIIQEINRGRGEGNIEVPNGLRKIIGDESVTQGRASALELANNFGISPSSVSAYAQGAHSTSSIDTKPDISGIITAKLRIAKKARNRLVTALNAITPDKISEAKVKDIAGVAKDMSAIIKNMEPESGRNVSENGPTFIFYSPQFRKEEHFDVVQVKE